MQVFSKGTRVQWHWANGTGEGKVSDVFTRKVSRTIKGSKITRNADEENPAYLIKQDDGDRVMKSHSELTKKTSS